MKVKSNLKRLGSASAGLIRRISWKGLALRLVCMVAGLAIIAAGLAVYSIGDPQRELYNAGMSAYSMAESAGEPGSPIHTEAQLLKVVGDARQLLEMSRRVYKAQSQTDAKSWLRRFLSPPADQHLAAMASFHEGMLFLALNQPRLTVQSFRLYLEIEPGGPADNPNMEDTYVDQYNLEMLLKANPSLGEGQGQGQGNGPGQPGNEPSTGQQAGKGSPTKI